GQRVAGSRCTQEHAYRIHRETQQCNQLADPKIKARLAEMGGILLAGSPADFGKFIAEETDKWGKVIRALNIKAEGGWVGQPTFHNVPSAKMSAQAHPVR